MRVVRHSDTKAFRQRVDDFLLRDEATHNTIIGITSRLMQGETYDDVFLAHVENDAGDVIAATMRTVPHAPVLSTIGNEAAIAILVDAYADVYDNLPAVLGSPDDSMQFAELWQNKRGQSFSILMEQGIYQLETVISPQNVNGVARLASEADFNLLVEWLIHFSDDTGLGTNYSRQEASKNISRKLKHPIMGGIRIWIDDGQAVSMAAVTRESPNGGVVSLVYTPPELRGRGYASAVTAAVSQAILDTGKHYSFLYTDLANPTSNKIYQAIGYEFVGNHRQIAFENRE